MNSLLNNNLLIKIENIKLHASETFPFEKLPEELKLYIAKHNHTTLNNAAKTVNLILLEWLIKHCGLTPDEVTLSFASTSHDQVLIKWLTDYLKKLKLLNESDDSKVQPRFH